MARYKPWMKAPRWLAVIRQLRCMACGRSGPSEANHVGNRGMSAKVADAWTIPLCHTCHMMHHSRNTPSIEWCREQLARLHAGMARIMVRGMPIPNAEALARALQAEIGDVEL